MDSGRARLFAKSPWLNELYLWPDFGMSILFIKRRDVYAHLCSHSRQSWFMGLTFVQTFLHVVFTEVTIALLPSRKRHKPGQRHV